MRLGIFGGSFDPPHIGHYLAAVDAAEQLELDCLLWVPVAEQPLKAAVDNASQSNEGPTHGASAEQRFEMVKATTEMHPKFAPSRIEIDRSGLSYTVATVEALANEYPHAERFLLIGADAWNQFESWYQPERIRTFVQVAVLSRAVEGEGVQKMPDHMLRTRRIDVSSTEVRARIRAGNSVRGFVPDPVAKIIELEGLYRW